MREKQWDEVIGFLEEARCMAENCAADLRQAAGYFSDADSLRRDLERLAQRFEEVSYPASNLAYSVRRAKQIRC